MTLAAVTLGLLNLQISEIIATTSDDLAVALTKAQPGMTVKIAPGDYKKRLYVTNIHGKPQKPITICALDPDNPPQFTGGGIQLSNISHVVVNDLVVQKPSDNGVNIDDGGKIDTPSHHIALRRIAVSDLPAGNHDGIKLSGVEDYEISDCKIERWGGSGIDMVGCHRGRILKCSFDEGGDSGIQAKGGSSDVTIERCLFTRFGQRGVNLGGSTGQQFFRPSLASMPAEEKYEAKNIQVKGCIFENGGAPIAFVGVDGATVKFNTLYRPGKWAIRILQETTAPGFVPCRNGVVTDNLIAFHSEQWSSGGVNIGNQTSPETFRFARNYWFCLNNPKESRPQLPTKEEDGIYGVAPLFKNVDRGDYSVPKGSAAEKYGAGAFK